MATRWRILLSIALLVLVLDQATKFQAVAHLTRAFERDEAQSFSEQLKSFAGGETLQRLRMKPVVLSRDFLRLKYVENPGAAWGMFGSLPDAVRVPFFFVISMVAITFILLFYRRLAERERLLQVALALVLGGALGNFADRILRGYVIDFIDLHWRNDPRLHWPTFNVADIAISVGVALLLSQTFFGRRHPFDDPQPAAAIPVDAGLLSERPVSATEAEAAILSGQPAGSEPKE